MLWILWNRGFIIGLRAYAIEDDGEERRSGEGSPGRTGKSPASPFEPLAQVHKSEFSGRSGKLAYPAVRVRSWRTTGEEVSGRLWPLHRDVGLEGSVGVTLGQPGRELRWTELEGSRSQDPVLLSVCLSPFSGEQQRAGSHWHSHVCLSPCLNRTTTRSKDQALLLCWVFVWFSVWPALTLNHKGTGILRRVGTAWLTQLQTHQRSVPCFPDSLEELLWDWLLVTSLEDFRWDCPGLEFCGKVNLRFSFFDRKFGFPISPWVGCG